MGVIKRSEVIRCLEKCCPDTKGEVFNRVTWWWSGLNPCHSPQSQPFRFLLQFSFRSESNKVLYECIGYVNCSKSTFSHQGKKERCKYITFSPTSVLSVTKYKKIESANCGQANVTVTEIKTEIKREDCNTVKPPDLPFL